MATHAMTARDTRENWTTLGWLWFAYGVIRLVVALVMVLYSGTATVMFGALLVRVPDAFPVMDIFHLFYFLAIILAFASCIVSLLAGLALLGGKQAARGLAIAAGFLSVSDVPLGTTLGVYTLIIFLA
jgi:uncharacterized membrane protein